MAPRAFVLRPLVRAMRRHGPRRSDEAHMAYLLRLSAAPPADRGTDRGTEHDADIADPYGQPVEVLWATASELDSLLRGLLGHLFPDSIRGT